MQRASSSRAHNRAAIGISQDQEPAPRGFLDRPHHWEPLRPGISLTGIGIVDREPNRRATYPRTCGKGPSFVMAPVVAVQHDPPGLTSHHRDDLVLEQHRQSERAGVERLRRGKVRDEQDQALKVSDSHEINLASKRRALA